MVKYEQGAEGRSATGRLSRLREKEAWFETHVWVHRPQLRNFMKRRKVAGHEVDDLCQETFLRIWRAYDPGSCERPKSVVFQTARNLIIDLARREEIVRDALALIAPQLSDACDWLDPLRWVSGEWELKRVNCAVAELSPLQQALVWYRRIEQLPEKGTARALRINVDRVDNQLRQATQQLRATIDFLRGPTVRGRHLNGALER